LELEKKALTCFSPSLSRVLRPAIFCMFLGRPAFCRRPRAAESRALTITSPARPLPTFRAVSRRDRRGRSSWTFVPLPARKGHTSPKDEKTEYPQRSIRGFNQFNRAMRQRSESREGRCQRKVKSGSGRSEYARETSALGVVHAAVATLQTSDPHKAGKIRTSSAALGAVIRASTARANNIPGR